MDSHLEAALRRRIMDWVGERAEANGGFVHRSELLEFRIDGAKLPIIDYSRGIRNPSSFESTLSIVSTANGPYDDTESEDGLLHYAYRKGDPWSGDNRKLRNAMTTGMPLVLFRKEAKNILTPVFPVYVVDDYPEERMFVIALDESFTFMGDVREMEPRGGSTRFDLPSSVCTNRHSARGSWLPTRRVARCASSGMDLCSTPRTSCPIGTSWALLP